MVRQDAFMHQNNQNPILSRNRRTEFQTPLSLHPGLVDAEKYDQRKTVFQPDHRLAFSSALALAFAALTAFSPSLPHGASRRGLGQAGALFGGREGLRRRRVCVLLSLLTFSLVRKVHPTPISSDRPSMLENQMKNMLPICTICTI